MLKELQTSGILELGKNTPEHEIDFQNEATVATHLTTDESGDFIFSETGSSAEQYIGLFSLLKHGHMPSIRTIAKQLTEAALSDTKFLEFIQSHGSTGQLYICSPGIYNVPSSSNLLLRETATRLNAFFSFNNMPTAIIKDLTRPGARTLDYALMNQSERKEASDSPTLMPSEFRGNPVVYLDDICITGTVLKRNKWRLLHEAHVSSLYFLVAAQMDIDVVARTQGKIEDEINRFAIDGNLLHGMLDLLQSDFTVVQKTLRVVLDPSNYPALQFGMPRILGKTKTTEIFLKIYIAAASNDFMNRMDKKYQPSLQFIAQWLQEAGIVSKNGLLLS